jgi:hypothetical protein
MCPMSRAAIALVSVWAAIEVAKRAALFWPDLVATCQGSVDADYVEVAPLARRVPCRVCSGHREYTAAQSSYRVQTATTPHAEPVVLNSIGISDGRL